MPRKMVKGQLTDRYKALLTAYFGVAKFNKSEAARIAGFKSAAKYVNRLFNHPAVRGEVQKMRDAMEAKYDISKERIAQELAALAFENLGDLVRETGDGDAIFDFTGLTTGQRKAMSEFSAEAYVEGRGPKGREVKKNKVKFHSKQAALEALARLMGYTSAQKNQMTDEAIVAMLNAGRARNKDEGIT